MGLALCRREPHHRSGQLSALAERRWRLSGSVPRTSAKQGPEPLALVLDNAPSHQSSQVNWAPEIKPLYFPAYSPELNPVEQLFRQIRTRLSHRIFEDLEAFYQALIEVLQEYWQDLEALIRLTASPWWVQGCQYQDNFHVNEWYELLFPRFPGGAKGFVRESATAANP